MSTRQFSSPTLEPRRQQASGPGAVLRISQSEGDTISSSFVERFVQLAGGESAVIVIIPCAATNPARSGEEHATHFRRFGAGDVRWLQVWQRCDANSAEAVATLQQATGIFLTGDDRSRLLKLLAETRALETIHRRHTEGAVVAAAGAGVSLLPLLPAVGGRRAGAGAAATVIPPDPDEIEVDVGLLSTVDRDYQAGWSGF